MSNIDRAARARRPPDFRWEYAWQETGSAGVAVLGVGIPWLLQAPIFLGYGLADDRRGQQALGLMCLTVGLLACVPYLNARASKRPRVSVMGDHSVALRARWSAPSRLVVLGGAVGLAYTVRWEQLPYTTSTLTAHGLPIVTAFMVAIALAYRGAGSRMVLSPQGIRLIAPLRDREIPWSAITHVQPDRRATAKTVVIHYREPAIAGGSARRPLSRWRRLHPENDGVHRIIAAAWDVNPNSLLATLIHLHSRPSERSVLTPAQLTHMLTVPSRNTRNAAYRRAHPSTAAVPDPQPPRNQDAPIARTAATRRIRPRRIGFALVAGAAAVVVFRSRR